jgi:flavodoxin I
MNTLVVYDTQFENTEAVAKAIAGSADGSLARASDGGGVTLTGVELLIVGAPTQGGRPTPAIQAFLSALPANALDGIVVAAFDTRFDPATQGFGLRALMKVIGYAAPKIAKSLTAKGGREIAPPEGFVVQDKEGPLREGELERAAVWARGVVAKAQALIEAR